MEIFLVRHTTPLVEKGVIYGRSDVPVCRKSFTIESRQIIEKVGGGIDITYSSPSTRCISLAKQLSESVLIDERLCEYDFGIWEGKTWASIAGTEVETWMNDFVNVSSPQGETMVDMYKRVNEFWSELTDLRSFYKKMVVITHGGVIRIIRAELDGIPLKDVFTIKVGYGEVLRIEI
jgi:alpha-ribazole phosphatase